jgi:tRNA G37 N-methylase TrmD
MRIEILTLFPGYFASPLRESLLGKAIASGLVRSGRDGPA